MLIVLIGCNHHNSKDKNADAEINEITLANVDLSKLKLEQTFFLNGKTKTYGGIVDKVKHGLGSFFIKKGT